MYVFVVVQDKESYYRDGPAGRVKVRLEQASGERCLIVPFEEFDLEAVEELQPRAVVMSGFGGHFQSRKIDSFFGMDEVFHKADLPILGICGSHQLMGFCFNRNLRKTKVLRDQPMRRMGQEEDLPRRAQGDPKYDLSGHFVADGFFPIKRVRPDPLFAGLPERMMMRCSHYCEVKKLPRGFLHLATSGHCRIEAMRHATRPVYGVQFHPEAYDAPFLHGRKLLENFARIVDTYWQSGGQ
jgi:GMP synthase (glutamine-hydrolysing)